VTAVIVDEPKLGGNATLRILVQDSPDILASLGISHSGHQVGDRTLQDLVSEKYGGAFKIEISHQPSCCADLFLQELDSAKLPATLRDELTNKGLGHLIATLKLPPPNRVDVFLLSVIPELTPCLWEHRSSGTLIAPPKDWQRTLSVAQRAWFEAHFDPQAPRSVQASRRSMIQLVRTVKQRLGSHIIFYNCSPLDADDCTHNYFGTEDSFYITAQQLNLILVELSSSEGVSIIDTERVVAEFGETHVPKALHYSLDANRAIQTELMRVFEDIGFFERRPLMVQIGRGGTWT
jgi:hypothetical protein